MAKYLVLILAASLVFVACGGGTRADPCEGFTCSGHGTCDSSSDEAVCVCDEGYTGDACDICDTGYQDNDGDGECLPDCDTSGLECGSHGTCDDSSGAAVCVCDVGYTGAACDTCDTGFQDNDGDGTCLPDCATSGLECGIHETCDDSSGSIECVCVEGYTGAACDTCDTGYQDKDGDGTCLPDCATSGLDCGLHGECDDSGGTVVCACDVGYEGAACETCADGFQDNDGDGTCLPDCATSGLDCGLHGTCDDSGGLAVCACDVGYFGATCETCADGFQDNDGNGTCFPDCATSGLDCGNHGTCDDSGGTAVCACDVGYVGAACEACAAGFQDNDGDGSCLPDCSAQDCSGHGTCDDSGGTAVCACDVGYTGAACDTCAAGYQDNDGDGSCLPDCATSGLDCGIFGTCDDSGGTAFCACDVGYVGVTCDTCDAGYQDNDGDGSCLPDCSAQDCSGHGTCDDSGGAAVCACDVGYSGAECDNCAVGYQDNDGDGSCLPDCVTSGLDCGLHGACDDSGGEAVCACDVGYAGALCDNCDAGYQDNDGDGSCLPDCSAQDCSGHGTCDDSSGATVCACDTGYTGAACETCDTGYQDNDGDGTCLPDCTNQTCSGHGTCDDTFGVAVCTCDAGWEGPDCSVEVGGIEWVAIPGGTFMMGSISGDADEVPVHQVDVPAFEMAKTEVTVAQYQACVDAVVCTEPNDYTVDSYCNWGQAGREDHPVNCVDWFQAVDFCSWVGGRLPSEAEWEYAARGGGQDITYPWGDDPASCTYAVMFEGGSSGCGMGRTWAVCSKTAGNTAQGLCDMAGNVWEWVQDWYHLDYNGAPSDGSAWEIPSNSDRVGRGGGFWHDAGGQRAAFRSYYVPSGRGGNIGFRCAR